ncbi:serine/threonine protein kinase [Oscillatoria sp. FACHB-1407]|uniref:serine/threonine-protein kinase n=1 Tax=Oscillatoria sp. FACHB-1407 TaxID=2692847 RepID=UPI00168848B2|nr:serine/threonine-protein kinase [Oscillatoria sp. FACHB-1407]MBD2461656.1 serine/threonine protein kinase [Oscillatoria sp. FACHB-1407]
MIDPNIGRILSNRYQLVELLGQGAMGRVYGARDVLLGGVPVAAKFLAQTLLNQKMRDRFEKEAKTCAGLGQRSMNIVRVMDYGADDDEIPYYIMEYLKGESLSDVISRQPLPLPRFVRLTRQVCLGLQCAHQGIEIDGEIYPVVHRDIKPSNILVIQDENFGELAKILDFGIAKVLQADSGQTNCFMGTLAYASPEQMEGHELDGRSDIYSLGVMMFQMLTGKMPLHVDTHTFGGWYRAHHQQPPRSFESANSNVKLPKPLENLVMSCLAKSPSDRPQSINEVLKALDPFYQKYSASQELRDRLKDFVGRVPINPTPKVPTSLNPEEICRLASWPADKPRAEIVFPNAIRTSNETLATLWVMMTQSEIEKRLICTRYKQFLFIPAPHPTLLWLTVLYNQEYGPRWVPCYLDLKSTQGQKMARFVIESIR